MCLVYIYLYMYIIKVCKRHQSLEVIRLDRHIVILANYMATAS